MSLSKDEQKLLDELTAKANEPDDEYEVIFEDENGRKVRMPASRAVDRLSSFFGDVSEDDVDDVEEQESSEEVDGDESDVVEEPVTKKKSYFKGK